MTFSAAGQVVQNSVFLVKSSFFLCGISCIDDSILFEVSEFVPKTLPVVFVFVVERNDCCVREHFCDGICYLLSFDMKD